ncbi:hypothetical protein YC2023_099093 [Brassica napus]
MAGHLFTDTEVTVVFIQEVIKLLSHHRVIVIRSSLACLEGIISSVWYQTVS